MKPATKLELTIVIIMIAVFAAFLVMMKWVMD